MPKKILEFILKSLLAGVLIGFGCIAFIAVESHILGSFLFSLGLLTVVIQGANLYTGKVGYMKMNWTYPLFQLLPMLLLNFIGIGVICWVFANFSGITLTTSSILAAKYSELWYQALIRSIGCGAMMYIAVDGYKWKQHPITIILPIMCFILCGFDHCIANYGYMAMNGDFFCPQLIIWVFGNAIGSLMINKLGLKWVSF